MMIKTFLKPMISIFVAVTIAFASFGLTVTSARAESSALGGRADFLLPLVVMMNIVVLLSARQVLAGRFIRSTGPNSQVMTMPLSDGTRLQVFVHKGKGIGYIRTL